MSAMLKFPVVSAILAAISIVLPWDHSGKNALNGRESGRVSASTVRKPQLANFLTCQKFIKCLMQLIEPRSPAVTMPDKTEI